jgi:hypothetical protein
MSPWANRAEMKSAAAELSVLAREKDHRRPVASMR